MSTPQELIQSTLCLIKPDGVRRGLTGEILRRIETSGLKIVAMKMLQCDEATAGRHYTWEDIGARHGEAVRNNLIKFICSGPLVALVVQGPAAPENLRRLCGTTEPVKSPPGTIRGDFCIQTYTQSTAAGQSVRNVIHASANVEDAQREIPVWFTPAELTVYRRSDQEEHWLY